MKRSGFSRKIVGTVGNTVAGFHVENEQAAITIVMYVLLAQGRSSKTGKKGLLVEQYAERKQLAKGVGRKFSLVHR